MSETLNFTMYSNKNMPNEAELQVASETYIAGFAAPPYNENFSEAEAMDAINYMLDKDGTVVFANENERTVALAGGYKRDDGSFYIEELVVAPDIQGRGIGRLTLEALMEEVTSSEAPMAFELRTNIDNAKAKNLYTSEGFTISDQTEIVPSKRTDGLIGLDERIYMRKNLDNSAEVEKQTLKRVAVMYPSGNTTAVVFDQLLDTDREQLNTGVMEAWKQQATDAPEIEQCCFVTKPQNPNAIARVEMFGGEFCGNATRSVLEVLLEEESEYWGQIEVSGADQPLGFSKRDGVIAVDMPKLVPDNVKDTVDGTIVNLSGIKQVVVTDKESRNTESARERLERLLKTDSYGLSKEPAVGVTYYDTETKQAEFAVWVNAVNTIFDETACGSGTTAIMAINLAAQTRAGRIGCTEMQTIDVVQPSGDTIRVTGRASSDSRELLQRYMISISGETKKLYDGAMTLR